MGGGCVVWADLWSTIPSARMFEILILPEASVSPRGTMPVLLEVLCASV